MSRKRIPVPRAGIEPARPFRAKGFSYHCGFHHQAGDAGPVWGLDYSFTVGTKSFRCVVSSLCTFLFSEAWLKIAISITC